MCGGAVCVCGGGGDYGGHETTAATLVGVHVLYISLPSTLLAHHVTSVLYVF